MWIIVLRRSFFRFPFSVFPALSSAWMKVWPLLMAKVPTRQPETGQATAAVHDEVDTGHNKTQNTNTPRWWLIESKSTFNLHVYWKSCWIFYSNAIPVCSTPCQLLNCIHPENENFSYSPTPPPEGGGGFTARYGLYKYVLLWRVWFSSSLHWDRLYKSESLDLE